MLRSRRVAWLVVLGGVLSGAAWGQAAYKFVVIGDSRGTDNGVNATILGEMRDAAIAEDPDLVLVTGDLVTNGSVAQLTVWAETFMDPVLAQGIGVYACRGNHDLDINAWNTVFSGPRAFPQNGPADELNLTYSFVHKNALFISMDSFMPDNLLRVDQAWLNEQLAAKTTPHVFVFSHYPAYPVAHTDCMASFPSNRDAFWDSLGAAGAKVYFTGHDHLFDHLRMMDGAGNWIHQYIVGTAGAPGHDWSGIYLDPRVEGISHVENNGYSVVEVAGDNLTIYFKQRMTPGVYAQAGDVGTFAVGATAVKPTADFSASVMSGAMPLEVRFQDESIAGTNPITRWRWDFGDGETSEDPSPVHTYTQAGFYDVSLTVSNDDGGNTISRKEYISVGLPVWGCFGSGFAIAGLLGFASRRMRKSA